MSIPICIFEDNYYSRLFPLSLTRPVYDLRCGIFTLKEKIRRQFPQSPVYLYCRNYLAQIVQDENRNAKVNELDTDHCLFINGRTLADSNFSKKIEFTKERYYVNNGQLVAAYLRGGNLQNLRNIVEKDFKPANASQIEQLEIDVKCINYLWDLVGENLNQIERDFSDINAGGQILGNVSDYAIMLNSKNIHVGANSEIKPGAILDAAEGPIFIGENVTIMSNAVIEGPAFIGDNSTIKIGAKIYEGTSIGEVCKIGGEVEESIVHSHSNKQHEGFLGHAYLGQWVNLGADTNNSDLKNNYGSVKVYVDGNWVDSRSQFVGLFMGDHSKSGINTMFNTGTVVGMMSNVFGAGFPPKVIPSFAWGGREGFVEYELEKALDTARRVMARRQIKMSSDYEKLLRHIFDLTKSERDQSNINPGKSTPNR
jgi:UDP-N-acetylglucosamine diphosphorylase/glucosamine-1-phosphate N-acetyltransferase